MIEFNRFAYDFKHVLNDTKHNGVYGALLGQIQPCDSLPHYLKDVKRIEKTLLCVIQTRHRLNALYEDEKGSHDALHQRVVTRYNEKVGDFEEIQYFHAFE